MGLHFSAKQLLDTALKALSPESRTGRPDPQDGPALPSKAPDPQAVEAFQKAMAGDVPPGPSKVDSPEGVDRQTGLRFPGDMEPGSAPRAPGDEASRITPEEYVKTVGEIAAKPDLSHSDLFRLQVVSSMAKIEITRNSKITKSLDDGMKTLIKSSS